MKKILHDFVKREIRKFLLSMAGLVLCLILIAAIPAERSVLPDFAIAFSAIIVLALGTAAARFFLHSKPNINRLSDSEVLLLERQYAADHPVYKVAYGEIHLLHDFIIGRNKGRLLVIALSGVEKVEERFRRVGGFRVPYITFILDTGKRIPVDFSARHCKDGAPVIDWLTKRLGTEKVERGKEKPSILR